MDKKELLLKMLPGFLPLLVFILADELWGTQIGMYVALGFGALEFIYTYLRTHKVDHFILLDTLLLAAMGGISIVLDNDVFFKLKPALIEAIFCLIMGISAYSPKNIIMDMSMRYMRGVEVNEEARAQMNRSMKNLFWIFCAHVLLVVFAALKLSTAAWGFISGGLFYILFGVYFAYEWLLRRRARKNIPSSNEEWVPIITEDEKIVGKAPRSQVHNGSKLLHPVVHLHVINSKRELFLQKRPMTKSIQPGKWDTAVGGHVSFGEDIGTGLMREASEEIGLDIAQAKPMLVKRYRWDSEVESELVYLFVVKTDLPLVVSPDEVEEGRYWRRAEIQRSLGRNVFTPNFEIEYKIIESMMNA